MRAPVRAWRVILIIIGLLAAGYLGFVIAHGPGTHLTEVDTRSGRFRHTYTVLGLMVSQRVVDSEFTLLLSELGIDTTRAPVWMPTSGYHYGIFGSTDHYYDGRGVVPLTLIAPRYFELAEVPIETRRATALQLLEWMEQGDRKHIEEWMARCFSELTQAGNQKSFN